MGTSSLYLLTLDAVFVFECGLSTRLLCSSGSLTEGQHKKHATRGAQIGAPHGESAAPKEYTVPDPAAVSFPKALLCLKSAAFAFSVFQRKVMFTAAELLEVCDWLKRWICIKLACLGSFLYLYVLFMCWPRAADK